VNKVTLTCISAFVGFLCKIVLLGNLEEGSSTGDFKSWMKGLWGWGITLSRGSVEGASGRAPSPVNLKDEVFERYAYVL
jgi:hypothetical protein